MSGFVRSWAVAIRLGRREALRARMRSLLVLVMVGLPVLLVTAAGILIQTSMISVEEKFDRVVGDTAEALVIGSGSAGPVQQAVDPDSWMSQTDEPGQARRAWSEVAAVIGERPRIPWGTGYLRVDTDKGSTHASVTEVDASDPLAHGLFRLEAGRWPSAPGEVVVNAWLDSRGPGLGETVTLRADGGPQAESVLAEAEVVGIAESAQLRTTAVVVAHPGTVGQDPVVPVGLWDTGWLVGGDPIAWPQVLELNQAGVRAFSREVVSGPLPETVMDWDGTWVTPAMVAIIAMIVVMALLEVVLLAGPAFAVGAKKQSRTLGLLASAGAEPRQLRRVVLGTAVVLGATGAVLGTVLGVAAAWLLRPVVQRFSGEYLGPFEVIWWHLLVVAGFGFASAVLAAYVPAWLASRQNVVAVLAGRRADPKPSRRSPVLGLVLVGAGVLSAVAGTRTGSDTGAILIAASALLCVLGLVLVVPAVVALLARTARVLPLSLRFAVRDATRHRTRTVPAVAAVAATIAGAVTLGIAVSSDEEQNRRAYVQEMPMGHGRISFDVEAVDVEADVDAARAALAAEAPGTEPVLRRAIVESTAGSAQWQSFSFRTTGGWPVAPANAGYSGGPVDVSDGRGLEAYDVIPADLRERARRVLAGGGAVVFTSRPEDASLDRVRLVRETYDETGEGTVTARADLDALVIDVGSETFVNFGIVSPEAADRVDAVVRPTELRFGAGLTPQTQEDLTEVLAQEVPGASLYVERGYPRDPTVVVVQLVLAALAGALMLGGTLTATGLALSDARPDLATLAAVGATPRLRRRIAAAYALGVALVGGLLGLVVGFVPGIAMTYPLTANQWSPDGHADTHVVDVPWLLLLGLVLALPLVVAAVAALFTRSRLPMVARVD